MAAHVRAKTLTSKLVGSYDAIEVGCITETADLPHAASATLSALIRWMSCTEQVHTSQASSSSLEQRLTRLEVALAQGQPSNTSQ